MTWEKVIFGAIVAAALVFAVFVLFSLRASGQPPLIDRQVWAPQPAADTDLPEPDVAAHVIIEQLDRIEGKLTLFTQVLSGEKILMDASVMTIDRLDRIERMLCALEPIAIAVQCEPGSADLCLDLKAFAHCQRVAP